MIDTKEVKNLIKFSGWGTPQSALHQQSSDTAAPSTAATTTSSRVPIATTAAPNRPATTTTTRMPMATTAAPSTEATAGTSNEPNTASPSAKKHYKKHFEIKTKQDWTDISWSTQGKERYLKIAEMSLSSTLTRETAYTGRSSG